MRRDRQAGDLAAHHLHRPAAHAADHVDFEGAVGHFQAAIEEGERIAAQHHGDRHRLAALAVFLAMDRAVVAGGQHEADRGLVVHLGAVGAGIEPVLLRVAGDREGAGADVAAAVLLVPDRRGKLGDVDGVAGEDVLEDRPVLDDLVRDDLAAPRDRPRGKRRSAPTW